jgi:hypothetical protein
MKLYISNVSRDRPSCCGANTDTVSFRLLENVFSGLITGAGRLHCLAVLSVLQALRQNV